MPRAVMVYQYSSSKKFCLQTYLKTRQGTHSPLFTDSSGIQSQLNPCKGIILKRNQLGHWTVKSWVQGEECRVESDSPEKGIPRLPGKWSFSSLQTLALIWPLLVSLWFSLTPVATKVKATCTLCVHARTWLSMGRLVSATPSGSSQHLDFRFDHRGPVLSPAPSICVSWGNMLHLSVSLFSSVIRGGSTSLWV